jgi:hypothetical protein
MANSTVVARTPVTPLPCYRFSELVNAIPSIDFSISGYSNMSNTIREGASHSYHDLLNVARQSHVSVIVSSG